ncbi:basic salivary proline-rich protein 1 isoform X2 [Culex pipiens pallens]|uniref:basic salivary proline-rich protein 1 isoform X2 n=1 Tax=Culex pipiens pallens TaxID=42434 RepID=UPI00195374B1|nr:basic salivary proline-rich protein 1 isoform X2 [Culex pipiens pallens]
MSAKKYLKTVPPQPPAQPAAKTEKEEQLWNALKRHIMRERERKKQEMEAEVEEERQRKEREAREKQDVMTLGETKEQISMMEKTLQELRNEKQQLFLQLKKVLNEDDNIRKRQMKEAAEMFPVHNIQQQQQQQQQQQPPPPQQQQQQIFLPAGRPTNPMPPHQQHLIHKVPTVNPPVVANVGKRTHSPSPQNYYPKPNTSQAYALPPQPQKMEEGRRGPGEVARAVLWNKSQYCPPGTLFYPTAAPPPQGPPTGPGPQDNRQPQPQQIIYPPYPQANIAMPIRQSYHVELPPQGGGSQKAPELIKTGPGGPPPGNVYHITLDQQGIPQQAPQNPGPPPQLKAITIEKIPEQYVRQGQPPQQPPPPTSHLPEGIVYTSALRPGAIPMHAIAANQQMSKGGGGSITQGYPPARPPQIVAQPQPPPGQMHYPRHRY